ncbi:MAG: GGDEF domain-containing protein [Aliarcobacter sp.]|nr:GGDEF domain-containing protein [Aliarcobacter sp.]
MHKSTVDNKIFVLLSIGIIILSSIGMICNYVFQLSSIQNNTKQYISKYSENLHNYLNNEINNLNSFSNLIINNNTKIEESYLSSNKKELYEIMKPLFDNLNKNNDITHFYFIKPNNEIFLRVHDFKKDSDIIDRFTFLKAKETQKPFYGLEFGVKNTFTLRYVFPWIVDEKIIGYIEIGKEINKITDMLSKEMKLEVFFAINKNEFQIDKNDIFFKDIVQTEKNYILYNESAIDKSIIDFINSEATTKELYINKKDFIAHKSILNDISGKDLGFRITLVNLTNDYFQLKKQSLNYALIMFFGTFFMLIVGYFFSKQKQKQINKAIDKIEVLLNNQEKVHENLKKLIDLQNNIIILTNGEEISFANKQFLTFFQYPDLDTFKKDYKCICELFIKDDRFFHLGKIKENQNWIKEIQKLPENQAIVSIKNKKSHLRNFSVHINKFEKELFIISFTDISKTIIEQGKLEEKISIDKLTSAYNREYFDKNIEIILIDNNKNGLKTAIIMLDIDYFKKVNDSYGHDVGDEILKEFVNILKLNSRFESDILIRWGGEEFLMILAIKDEKSLLNIIEKYRKAIENHNFKPIKITCSIGASIHNNHNKIQTTIKEADIALYEAKNLGRNRIIIYKK